MCLLASGMVVLGRGTSTDNNKTDNKTNTLSTANATWQTLLLMGVPPLMYMASFRKRITSQHASMDEWYELLLVCTVPYLLKYATKMWNSAPQVSLRGTLLPICMSIIASLSLQQAYMIPFCQSIAYQFHGHELPPTWLTSLYLTMATISTLLAVWISGRVSVESGEKLFGDYHEDVLQVSLAWTGLCLGKAIGMPWNLTPLPILAFLGLSVWITTRMVCNCCC